MGIPVSLIIALIVQQLCQIIKFVAYSLRDRKISPGYLTSSGGMPSAHSAFVAALCTAVAVRAGTGSELFSVSLVMAVIVIHDALRVRGALERVIQIVKTDHPEADSPAAGLPETIGHSGTEIAAGILLGSALALPAALLTRGL